MLRFVVRPLGHISKRSFADSSKPVSNALWERSQEYKVHGRDSVVLGNGNIAGLAHGAAVGQDGNSVVLATVVSERTALDESAADDGTPFNVEYKEKAAASGRIPTTPNRREAPNNENEILTGRAVDRCLRPLFPPLFKSDTQLMASVQAFDANHFEPPISLVANTSSAALHLSDVPWNGPIGCVRVGRINGRLVAEPTKEQMAESDLDLVYAGTADRTVMIEMAGREINNAELKKALRFAHDQIAPIVDSQKRLRDEAPVEKRSSMSFISASVDTPPDLSAHQRTESWNPLKGFFGKDTPVAKVQDGSSLLKEAQELAESLDAGEAKSIFANRDTSRAERAYKEAMLTKRLCSEIQSLKPHWSSSLVGYVAHERLWLGMRGSVLDAHDPKAE
jgi:polyribonucleotide nucleotidyltransferase